jgi:hypothetical protein
MGNGRPMMARDDPDVMAVIAEVDAILCAALTAHRRPPTPPPATNTQAVKGR